MASVAILMATFNGEKFLGEQLASIAAQTHTDWHLHVSDDGSTDSTRALVSGFASSHPVTLHEGPTQGHVRNFLSLLSAVSDADHYAFCDQDDVWETEKLARALEWLRTVPADVPALYGSRTLYMGAEGTVTGLSTSFPHPPSFKNALVQCYAGGNTMVMNKAARDLIALRAADVKPAAHDWWAYIMVSGAGGKVHYDNWPSVRYRQHGGNQLGQNTSAGAKLSRIGGVLDGTFKTWNDLNVEALERVRLQLAMEHRTTLYEFAVARKRPLAARLSGLYASGIHRQTLLGNLGLAFAALTNRI